MKFHAPPFALLPVLFTLLTPVLVSAVFLEDDRTLAPYFFIPGGDESADPLPLKSTDVDVRISGVIAEVRLVQEYQNLGASVIEAVYTFPLSTRAAVHGMKMIIGERVLIARVQEKSKARKIYQQAKEEGKTTSLLEQHRPNVFTMNLANILPGDVIKVEVQFTEILVPEQNVYTYVFPTVVGPRYSEHSARETDPGKIWVQNPYLSEETPVQSTFNLKISLNGGLPVQDVVCRTHKVVTAFDNENSCRLSLSPEEQRAADRDFILEYRLAGNQIHSGLLLYEGERENFFLFMAQPPERPSPEMIPPRDYVFILDVSGSMHGFPLAISKGIMKSILATLRPKDSFNVLLFAAASEVLSKTSIPATAENINLAWDLIDRQEGGGGTRLLPAMKRALKLPKSENVSRSIVVLTDGYVDVELETFEIIRNNLGNANLFAFGIGSSVNRHIIEGMARVGQGESFVATDIYDAAPKARQFFNYISAPVMTNIEVAFRGMSTYDVEPKTFPDLFAERPVLVFGKWKGKAHGEVVLRGVNGAGEIEQAVPIPSIVGDRDHSALRYLWARSRIARLSDFDFLDRGSEYKMEVTNLGLTYNLATRFTSFVAVEETPRNLTGKTSKVQQAALQPKGVGKKAFSSHVPSTPEPRTYILGFAVAITLLIVWLRHLKPALVAR